METQILAGTFQEVQKRFVALPLKPDTHLRVVISEPVVSFASEEELLANAPSRNGVILVPTKRPDILVTVEMVKELSEG